MANAVLVDSNFYISRHRVDADPFLELDTVSEFWEPVTCGMVVLEVLRGFRNETVCRSYREAFGVMSCVPTTDRIWDSAMELLRTLARKGFTLPPQDALIAASALSIDAPVLTFDAHFKLIPKLTVLDSLS
jgi:predicted nucleic acid-binding protein